MSPDDGSMGSMAGTLGWYRNRLRCMSPAEIPHRLLRAVQARAGAAGLRSRRRPPAPVIAEGAEFVARQIDIDATDCLRKADDILAGRLDVFALPRRDVGHPPDWNRDPKTGVRAPMTWGKRLDYRDPGRVGDIKYLWEPNRHQHFVTLAQAWRLSGERRYLDGLGVQIDSWLRDCPTGFGPNWASALEPALRLVNWSLAWQIAGGADSPLFDGADGRRRRRAWLDAVYEHARFVRGFYSRHSSANNHLIGEATGVHIAGLTWPYWPELERWSRQAAAILEREALRQNAADGVNLEQAFAYQQYELDLLLLNWLASVAGGRALGNGFADNMQRMLEFLASVMDAGGNVPMVGDSDDGYVVRLATGPDFDPYRSLLATGALLFDRADFRDKAGELDERTRWLLGDATIDAWSRLPERRGPLPVRRAFPDGGYYLLGCDWESDREIRLLADCGPLGYREIAAHGHADALSFTLSVAGLEFLIDPGTYAYHADDHWRQYFRGTAAHNTLRIDGRDQSEPGGNFMWLDKARADCLHWRSDDAADELRGRHDGYCRLPDPVTHERFFQLDKATRRILIEDRLSMQGAHDVELLLHVDERCVVRDTDDGVLLSRDGQDLRISLPGGGRVERFHGSERPLFGWVSRRYDERRPCTTLRWRARLEGDTRLCTVLQC